MLSCPSAQGDAEAYDVATVAPNGTNRVGEEEDRSRGADKQRCEEEDGEPESEWRGVYEASRRVSQSCVSSSFIET